jgi:hypothetical protein
MGACEGMSSTRGYNLIQFDSCGILFGSVTSAMMNRTIPARVISSKPDYYMLLRIQKAAVRGNYETGNQAFSMHLGFLIHTGGERPIRRCHDQSQIPPRFADPILPPYQFARDMF